MRTVAQRWTRATRLRPSRQFLRERRNHPGEEAFGFHEEGGIHNKRPLVIMQAPSNCPTRNTNTTWRITRQVAISSDQWEVVPTTVARRILCCSATCSTGGALRDEA
eukprot:6735929-Pyramimonas_sp.AAC.1